ncbi:MAG: chalcone isomerase family protein [Rubrivivax sp.]
MPDAAFYNALLKIWIGDKPADSALKPLLLGGKPPALAEPSMGS